MKKKLKYYFSTNKMHEVCGNPEYETEEFLYEVNENDLIEFIEEVDLWDEIKEYFEEKALEEYNKKHEED